MPARRIIGIIVLAMGLAAAPQGPAARPARAASAPQAAVAAEPEALRWGVVTVDAVGSVGDENALGFDPATGQAINFYSDATGEALKTATNTGATSSQHPCAVAGWECDDLLGRDVIMPAIDYTPSGDLGMVGYLPELRTNVFFGDTSGGGALLEPIDVEYLSDSNSLSGLDSALKYDSAGKPHIAYFRNNPNPAIRYATYVGSGGNCGGPSQANRWQCDTIVTTTGGLFHFNTVAIDFNSAGTPYIAFRNLADSLSLAYYVGSGGNCGTGGQLNKWQCDVIDSAAAVHAIAMHLRKCTILCTGNEASWIAYRDANAQTLRVARLIGSGGNCGSGTNAAKWQCATIETVGASNIQSGVDIVYNYAHGTPYIAYPDADDQANRILKVAYATTGGNCGANAWRCQVIDDGADSAAVGLDVAIAVSPQGHTMIAYADGTNRDLKIARQLRPTYLALTLR